MFVTFFVFFNFLFFVTFFIFFFFFYCRALITAICTAGAPPLEAAPALMFVPARTHSNRAHSYDIVPRLSVIHLIENIRILTILINHTHRSIGDIFDEIFWILLNVLIIYLTLSSPRSESWCGVEGQRSDGIYGGGEGSDAWTSREARMARRGSKTASSERKNRERNKKKDELRTKKKIMREKKSKK